MYINTCSYSGSYTKIILNRGKSKRIYDMDS